MVLVCACFKNLEEAINRVTTLVENLKSSALLSDSTLEDQVKLHNIVHGVAIEIAYRDKHWYAMNHLLSWEST